MSRKTSTETLIAAMRVLARDIQSGDGVANSAIAEAADRLAEQQARIADLEAQAAIGRRAVEMLQKLEWLEVLRGHERSPRVGHCVLCGYAHPITGEWEGHRSDCSLAAILRDAANAGVES